MRDSRTIPGPEIRPVALVLVLAALGFGSWSLGHGKSPSRVEPQPAPAILLASLAREIAGLQWDEARGCPPSDLRHGGIGRDERSTPDLATTVLTVQALRAAGVPRESETIRRAVIFIAHCQDLSPPAETPAGGASGRGGFASLPPGSEAEDSRARRDLPRPTGLSTCLGITGLLTAGVAPDDPRVTAALDWVQAHYTLDANPGTLRPDEGLYGYYYELAKVLTALGQERLRDRRGVAHDWRRELERKLVSQQYPDGSWHNPDESPEPGRSHPTVTTSYALLTLRQISK